ADPNAPAAAPAEPKKKIVKRPPPKERGIVTDDPLPALVADSIRLIQEAAQRYRQIAETGGWPSLPKQRLALGSKGPAVVALRQRLAAEGDLDAGATSQPVFDKALQDALKQFQSRHGLARSGVVAGSTLEALNVSAATRARQLENSAQRLVDRNLNLSGRYVVVNIPSASVEAVENGSVRRRYVAVVGKPENASPQVDARIGTVNINPTWTVPTSIIKNEFIPKMRSNPANNFLARSNIRILDRSGNTVPASSIDWSTDRAVNYTFRQDSGSTNSLGQIRIDMPNRDAVYMHDTPSKRFFNAQDRFFSHGCVRVQDVKGLAAWLLEGTAGNWDKSTIEAAISEGERKDIRLARPVPVAWVYLTGYVTDDGKTHFRDDVYSLDTPQAMASLVARRTQRQAQREAQQQNADFTASVPSAGSLATGQMIDPPVSDAPRRGWLWW
ncbi:MAG TPA: L,D-transpeptidase family protein, partial [Beijerinckiaceae bacterium]|nr:L,D-transpeptidase family protein [Beijerinckiaceae bacterium]